MLKIYIARHGQDEDNANGILNGHRDQPLTKLGESQAAALAGSILEQGLKFDAVYVSPLLRTRQTAQLVVDKTNSPEPVILPSLIERNFGVMSGEPVAGIAERFAPNILQAGIVTYFLEAEGAETFPDLLARGAAVLADLQARHPFGTILLVTHGDLGKMIYAAFYKLSWEQVMTQFHFGNSELLLLAEDSPAADAHVFQTEQFNH
jgi:probable phosphoglycerate mutase